MKNFLWRVFAFIVSRQVVADYLIGRATRTPYCHLDGYMNRYWLFNRYSEIGKHDVIERRFPRLPSARVHHILRRDSDRHMHDHPWNARTIILRGHYVERVPSDRDLELMEIVGGWSPRGENVLRERGDTATINFGDYHSIDEVSEGGVWTLFFTWEYVGTWGFLVNGVKVPWREYLEANHE